MRQCLKVKTIRSDLYCRTLPYRSIYIAVCVMPNIMPNMDVSHQQQAFPCIRSTIGELRCPQPVLRRLDFL